MKILAIIRNSTNALNHCFSFFHVTNDEIRDITGDIAEKLGLKLAWNCGKPYLRIKGERWTAIHYLMKIYGQKINQKINYEEC
ncbi:hypothetical protein MOVS_10710 (plasmid) [Moraxella ovis]|uniref:Uncharacterized protein n=1 Tax=Moraxella ovis TaxID=29433 RepID=A0A378QCW2_9GAMM|nr:hypothetical protein [Moraxella ovis]ANB92559.1 hypothetical protein MOVS_10710 [Moraxella ovis]STY98550.1 Uncharacterised protein [Moraxella ovis]STY98598.1 Uncharacterised protein [Moraxella ovis]